MICFCKPIRLVCHELGLGKPAGVYHSIGNSSRNSESEKLIFHSVESHVDRQMPDPLKHPLQLDWRVRRKDSKNENMDCKRILSRRFSD